MVFEPLSMNLREVLKKHRKPAAAKSGQMAQVDMSLPSGPTGMDPSQTSFFQALNIGTKIVKGQIELVSDFPILKQGEKVSPSAAVLLTKLGIKPFEYGMEVEQVFQDGSVFPAAVLDIKEEVLITKFLAGIANMAAFSREIGIPTEAALPHMFGNAFRNIAALVADKLHKRTNTCSWSFSFLWNLIISSPGTRMKMSSSRTEGGVSALLRQRLCCAEPRQIWCEHAPAALSHAQSRQPHIHGGDLAGFGADGGGCWK